MKSGWKNIILFLNIVLLSIISIVCVSCWGEPSFKIIFDNQSASNLTIYLNEIKVGNVGPGEQTTASGIPMTITKFHIEAQNPQGESIFSETLTREQMKKTESRVYKVVIPAS
jgi:hypothetical protein